MSTEHEDRSRKEDDPQDEALASLYRKADNAQPPEHLDDAILAASRRAVQSRPRAAGPFAGRWHIPASVAAMLVLTVILVPLLDQEIDEGMLPKVVEEQQEVLSPLPSRAETRSRNSIVRSLRYAPENSQVQAYGNGAPSAAKSVAPAAPSGYRALSSLEAGSLDEAPLPADQWLQRIDLLLNEGSIPEARQQLTAFRESYPDYAVDPELLERMEPATPAGVPAGRE